MRTIRFAPGTVPLLVGLGLLLAGLAWSFWARGAWEPFSILTMPLTAHGDWPLGVRLVWVFGRTALDGSLALLPLVGLLLWHRGVVLGWVVLAWALARWVLLAWYLGQVPGLDIFGIALAYGWHWGLSLAVWLGLGAWWWLSRPVVRRRRGGRGVAAKRRWRRYRFWVIGGAVAVWLVLTPLGAFTTMVVIFAAALGG